MELLYRQETQQEGDHNTGQKETETLYTQEGIQAERKHGWT